MTTIWELYRLTKSHTGLREAYEQERAEQRERDLALAAQCHGRMLRTH